MSTDAQAGAEPVVQRVLSFAGVDGASDADNFFDNLGDASPGSKASTAVPRPDAVAEPLRAVTPAAQPVVEDSAAGAAHASRDAVQRLATQPEDAVPAEGNGGDALPDGWVVGTAPSGHTYFFHHPTGTSQWEHPGGGAAAALDAAAAPSTGDAAGAGGVPYAAVPQPEPQLQPQPQPQQLLQQQPQQHQQQHQQQHWVGAQREHPFQSAAAAVVPPWSGAHANGAGSQHPAPSPTATLVPAGRSPHGRPRCCAAAFTPGGVVVVASRDGAALHAHPLRSLLPPPPPAWAPPLSRLRGGGLEEGARVADARDGCLWAILGAAARAKGHLSDPHAASSISAALLRAHDDSGAAGSQPLQPTLPPPQPPAPDACARVEQLLLSGRREEAVAAASDAGMHGCALLLCRSLPAAAAERATAAAASAVAPPGSALHTSLVLCAGHPALVGGGAGDEAGCSRLLASWRPNLAAMLAARAPGDGPAMVGLGDALVGVGCIEGAHACYLLAGVPLSPYDPSARLVLPGADHRACPRTYADDWDAHLMAELSEACSRALYPGVHPPGAAAAAAHRLAFAASLAEAGRPAEGAAAAEGAAKCVRAAGAAAAHEVNVQLVLAVAASLEERLRGAGRGAHGGGGGGGAAGKLLGLSLGGLSSLLDKGLASVFGDDAGAGGAGGAPQPFSRSASAASELSSEGGAQPHQPPPQPRASRGDPGDPGAHEPKGGMIRSISSLLLGGGKRASRPETANKCACPHLFWCPQENTLLFCVADACPRSSLRRQAAAVGGGRQAAPRGARAARAPAQFKQCPTGAIRRGVPARRTAGTLRGDAGHARAACGRAAGRKLVVAAAPASAGGAGLLCAGCPASAGVGHGCLVKTIVVRRRTLCCWPEK